MTTVAPVFAVAAVLLVVLVVMAVVVRRYLIVVRPNEAVILSGRPHRLPDGSTVGYRIVTGGRTLRIPILEMVSRLDLSSMVVEVDLTGAYCLDNTPVDVRAVASVKVSSNPAVMRNAVERFLDRDRREIETVARETVEGALRRVVASVTPEELDTDREAVDARLAELTDADFDKLGLQLDTFNLQSVKGTAGRPLRRVHVEPERPAEAPRTATVTPKPPAAETAVPEGETDPADLLELANPALDRSEREAVAERLRGREIDLSVTVSRLATTTSDVPDDYTGGQTVLGTSTGGLAVAVCFRPEDDDWVRGLKAGEVHAVRGEVNAWDELYARLVVMAWRQPRG